MEENTNTAVNTEVIRFEAPLSDEQKMKLGDDIANLEIEVEELQAQKKKVSSEMQAKITSKTAEVLQKSKILNSGVEETDLEVRVEYDWPQKGMKTYYDLKTGQEIKAVEMTEAENEKFAAPLFEKSGPDEDDDFSSYGVDIADFYNAEYTYKHPVAEGLLKAASYQRCLCIFERDAGRLKNPKSRNYDNYIGSEFDIEDDTLRYYYFIKPQETPQANDDEDQQAATDTDDEMQFEEAEAINEADLTVN